VANILVLDTNLGATALLMARHLADHDVATAATGNAVLALLEAGARFDVIFARAPSPEMSLLELRIAIAAIDLDQARRLVLVSNLSADPSITASELRETIEGFLPIRPAGTPISKSATD